MKTTNRQTPQNAPGDLAVVRTMIEREFPSLSEQQPRILQLALNEAEAIAWQTGFAHLLFPLLAMEKASAVAAWHARQESILQSEPVLSFAE